MVLSGQDVGAEASLYCFGSTAVCNVYCLGGYGDQFSYDSCQSIFINIECTNGATCNFYQNEYTFLEYVDDNTVTGSTTTTVTPSSTEMPVGDNSDDGYILLELHLHVLGLIHVWFVIQFVSV